MLKEGKKRYPNALSGDTSALAYVTLHLGFDPRMIRLYFVCPFDSCLGKKALSVSDAPDLDVEE